MSCLKINNLYEYLEGGLSPERTSDVEIHLSVCRRCRRVVEERRLIAEAASTLPPFEVPEDFPERVMARVAQTKVRTPAWLIILASASSLMALTAVVMIASGSAALGITTRAGHSLSEYVKSAAIITARAVTLLSLAGKTVRSLLESAAKGLSLANSFLSPVLLVVMLGLTTVLILSLALAARKKISLGD